MIGIFNFAARKDFRKILEHATSIGLTSDHIKQAVLMGKEKVLAEKILELFEEATGLKDKEKDAIDVVKEVKVLPKLDTDLEARTFAGAR